MTVIQTTIDPGEWWNVNIPPSEHTAECPAFLLRYCPPGSTDSQIIGTPDAQYRRLSWSEVKDYVANNRPDVFQRVPSHLRKYRHFCYQLEDRYGSILDFMVKQRLQWSNTVAISDNFTPGNYKVIFNDWPYGFDKRIVHLVVWTKFMMVEDADTGLLLPDMQRKVDEFVEKTFTEHCAPDSVVWFRNWASLKSVHAVEHIHVLLYKPDAAWLDEVTGGDCPLAVKLGYLDHSEIAET